MRAFNVRHLMTEKGLRQVLSHGEAGLHRLAVDRLERIALSPTDPTVLGLHVKDNALDTIRGTERSDKRNLQRDPERIQMETADPHELQRTRALSPSKKTLSHPKLSA